MKSGADPSPEAVECDVNKIVQLVEREVRAHGYLPENFMFIFPVITGNKLIHVLHRALKDFWQRSAGIHDPVVLH
jgi:hypothetical protein